MSRKSTRAGPPFAASPGHPLRRGSHIMPGMPRRGAIDFGLDGIGHVLEDASLAVPVYQRSFAWADDQINDFWADLK